MLRAAQERGRAGISIRALRVYKSPRHVPRRLSHRPERSREFVQTPCPGSSRVLDRVWRLPSGYRLLMEDADRGVLEFVGDQGKTAGQVAERFPAFAHIEHLVRALKLTRPRRTNPFKTQSRRAAPAPDPTFSRAHLSRSRGHGP